MTKENVLGEVVFKIFLLLFGLYYFIETITMSIANEAKIYPFLISAVFIILMVMLTIEALKKFINQINDDKTPFKIITHESKKIIGVYLAGILLITLTLAINFWVALFIVIPLITIILEDMKFSPVTLLIMPVSMTIIVYFIFIRLLSIRLPIGF